MKITNKMRRHLKDKFLTHIKLSRGAESWMGTEKSQRKLAALLVKEVSKELRRSVKPTSERKGR